MEWVCVALSLYFSAVVMVRFRALSPNGLVFYMGNSRQFPTQWMSLALQRGYLYFTVQTNTMSSVTIMSNLRYDNGNWSTVTLLRLHNFLALVS